jgi:hypothetical protein
MTAYPAVSEEEVVTSKRDSTLRYLALLCQEITGSRGHGRPGCLTIEGILEAVAVEAYVQILNASWRVIPARFFKAADSQPEPSGVAVASSAHG